MPSGIYKITNKINKKYYIGSAIDCHKRWYKKYNKHLEAAFKKYGKDNFLFEIIEEVEDCNQLIEREQHYIDILKPEYNIRLLASSNLGIKASSETKEKLSIARRMRITTSDTCRKISEALKGRQINWKDKIAIANSGENNYNYGNELSAEWKEKISKTLLGRKKTDDHRKNISNGLTGRKLSVEHKKKLSEAAKNRNTETKIEIAITNKPD